jgi:hypothetical protein
MISDIIYDHIKVNHPKLFVARNNGDAYNARKLYSIPTLTQSDSIRLGNLVEHILANIVSYGAKGKLVKLPRILTESILENKIKREKQIDLLIEFEQDYLYLEIKSNAELDSEKWPHTVTKIGVVSEAIASQYGKPCEARILTPWYNLERDMAHQYRKKEIMFVSEYFQRIGVDMTKEQWYSELNRFAIRWQEDTIK